MNMQSVLVTTREIKKVYNSFASRRAFYCPRHYFQGQSGECRLPGVDFVLLGSIWSKESFRQQICSRRRSRVDDDQTV